MADYRHDCCGGFPGHSEECRNRGEERKKVADEKKAVFDRLWAKYGELVVMAERSTTDHTRTIYGNQAEGIKIAIRIIEGVDV